MVSDVNGESGRFASAPRHVLIDLANLLQLIAPSKVGIDSFVACLTEPYPKPRIGNDAAQSLRERGDISARHQQSVLSVTNDIGDAAGSVSHTRHTIRPRFQ